MSSPQNVLLVVTKSNFGGAQRYVYDLATHLPKEDFYVTVAAGPTPHGKPGALFEKLDAKNIRTLLVPELARDVDIFRDWSAFNALRALFRAEKAAIVHLNSSKVGGLGALAARLEHVPRIIFTLHGFPADENRSLSARWAIACATWATVALSHITIVISQTDFQRLSRMPFIGRRVMLVRNGITTPAFKSREEARATLCTLDPSLPENATWVGAIGELHPNKNWGLAIDALQSLSEKTHLVIVGDGEERTRLMAHAAEKSIRTRVHFVGFVREAASLLRAFDCIVLSSHKEGLPYVLIEAGFAHLPVVATRVGGVPDIIAQGETGVLVNAGDAHALSSGIASVTNDARIARSYAEALLRHVQQWFSLENMVYKIARLYRGESLNDNTLHSIV